MQLPTALTERKLNRSIPCLHKTYFFKGSSSNAKQRSSRKRFFSLVVLKTHKQCEVTSTLFLNKKEIRRFGKHANGLPVGKQSAPYMALVAPKKLLQGRCRPLVGYNVCNTPKKGPTLTNYSSFKIQNNNKTFIREIIT
ncbi:unnamed protein product [Spodoptera exigua]|nr:unnamed protein product [Spodoptera exigua]